MKKLRFSALAIAGLLLSLSVSATMIQSDGILTVNSDVFIDSHFEFTEENQATLENENNETIFTAVTLAQIRSMDSDINENNTQALAHDSVAKLSPMKHFEVGWQKLSTYN